MQFLAVPRFSSFSLSSFLFAPNYKCSTTGLLTVGEFASFPGWFVWHSEDTGCLLHDPHEEVVDVVLEFPDVGVFPPKELFVLHQLLQDLLVGQTTIPCGGIKRVVVLKQEKDGSLQETEHGGQLQNYSELQFLIFQTLIKFFLCPWLEPT